MRAAFKDSVLLQGQCNGIVYLRENATESYVVVPPAHVITMTDGSTWTFGSEYVIHNGEFEFNVLRNDVDTGEFAKRIEYQKGALRIYGSNGRKTWSRSRRGFV